MTDAKKSSVCKVKEETRISYRKRKVKKPNLFIIGAPKCGTTSIASWLGDHPKVFMSPVKEPHYFDLDHQLSGVGNNIKKYEELFKNSSEKYQLVAEASTRYLSSVEAVSNIMAYNSEAQFVVCLRNPIEMVYSLHQQELFEGYEIVDSFEQAWHLQSKRAEGKEIPYVCKDPIRLQYGQTCAIGSQCEALLRQVSQNRVHFILLDDLKNDTLTVYKKLLEFLELPYDGRTGFIPENTSKTYKSKTFVQLMSVASYWKRKLGIYKSFGLSRFNMKKVEKPPLQPNMENELIRYFQGEIAKLSTVLHRDLSHWMVESR